MVSYFIQQNSLNDIEITEYKMSYKKFQNNLYTIAYLSARTMCTL